jgi:hypothetical protein
MGRGCDGDPVAGRQLRPTAADYQACEPGWSEAGLTGAWTGVRRTVGVMPEPEPEPRPHPSRSALFSSWVTYDAPFAAKLRMAAANTLVKLRNHQGCCGNHGQPGC